MIDARMSSNVNRVRLRFSMMASGFEEKAAVRALNRAGDQTVTAIGREIRRVYNVSARLAREQTKVRDRARKGKLNFTIRIFSRRIPLIEFAARQTRRGVTVQVKKGGSRKLIARSFLAKMDSGHQGVMVRSSTAGGKGRFFRFGRGSGKAGRKWGDPDTPIAELTTLSLPRMFVEKSVRAAVSRIATESFRRNFEQQLKFLTFFSQAR